MPIRLRRYSARCLISTSAGTRTPRASSASEPNLWPQPLPERSQLTKVLGVPRHRARISTRRLRVVLGSGLAIAAVVVAVGYVLGRGSDHAVRATAADSPTWPQPSTARSVAPRPSPPAP